MYGVSLKYAAISAGAGLGARAVLRQEAQVLPASQAALASLLCYTCLLNGLVALLFNLGVGMRAVGKSPKTGCVPKWSYLLYFGFHFPTWLYTRLHHWKDAKMKVPVATEVEPGWWVGGRYAAELGKSWAGVLDMTCEFPEGCRATTDQYLLLPCWDGVPPSPDLLERAALFAISARAMGDVLVHCAHGRGRSTTVMCACLVKGGLHPNWETAFEAIKKQRRVAKLNRAMRSALSSWQSQYMETTPTKIASNILQDSIDNDCATLPVRSFRSLIQKIKRYGRSKLK